MNTDPNPRVALTGLSLSLLFLSFPGCRTIGSVMGDRDAKPRGNITWAQSFGEEIDIMPSEEKKTLFLAPIRNPGGSDLDVDLLDRSIRDGVKKRGWRLASAPEAASYQLSVILHYWGENPDPDGGDRVLAHARGLLAAAGAVAGGATGDNWREVVVRGAAGAVVGYGVGTAVANRSRPNEWNLVIETRLEERVEGEVTHALSNGRHENMAAATAGDSGDGGTRYGTTTEGTTKRQDFQSVRDRYRHRNVLVGYARQIQMTEEEAFDYLTPKLEKALPGILP